MLRILVYSTLMKMTKFFPHDILISFQCNIVHNILRLNNLDSITWAYLKHDYTETVDKMNISCLSQSLRIQAGYDKVTKFNRIVIFCYYKRVLVQRKLETTENPK